MKFIPGLQLAERFHQEIIAPLLSKHWPQLNYSAGLFGDGSEVLGFDTERSTDHDWGPRLYLFLEEKDFAPFAQQIVETIAKELPATFHGYATAFDDRDRHKILCLDTLSGGSVKHGVEIFTPRSFFKKYLAIDPLHPIEITHWLTMPEQLLLAATSGKIFHDALGIEKIRQQLAFYPHEVWLYILAAQWARIEQEEAFLGRCDELGDIIGARILAARLVRDMMKLCFLMEKKYAPYSKWLGTAFSRLKRAPTLSPIFENALAASSPAEQEKHMCSAYQAVAGMHNDLGITKPLSTDVSLFHDRPYRVLNAERFADAINEAITEPQIQALKKNVGSVNQFVDSTDILCYPDLCRKFNTVIW